MILLSEPAAIQIPITKLQKFLASDRQRDHTPPIFNHQIIEKKPSPCSVKLCFTAFLTENLTLEFYERKKHVAIHPHDTRSLQDPNVLQVFPNC
jgi:hypothetical protein